MLDVVVTGTPRSGTTSVAAALNNLGLSVLHYCPISIKKREFSANCAQGDFIEELIKENILYKSLLDYDCIASWRFLGVYKKIELRLKPKKIIVCTRSKGLETSLHHFGFDYFQIQKMKEDLHNALSYFTTPKLVVDISKRVTYNELKGFLDIHSEFNGKIPKMNVLKRNYEI